MVQPFELIQTRIISGKGILIIPEEFRTARDFALVLDILRLPSQPYFNFAYNPPKSGYGLLTFNRRGRTLSSQQMIFDPQEWDFQNDPTGQTLIAIKCAYVGILETFFNLGVALSLPPISVVDNTSEMSFSETIWDTVKAKCYADTQIQLRLYARQWDACGEEPIRFSQALPADNDPPTKKPQGTPATDNSPPYDPGTNDNGDTVPYPGDSTPAPPPVTVRVTYNIGAANGQPDGGLSTQDFQVPSTDWTVVLVAGPPSAPCPSQQPQVSVARNIPNADIFLFYHNTCNALTIVSQEFV